jgi:hypothetical protein
MHQCMACDQKQMCILIIRHPNIHTLKRKAALRLPANSGAAAALHAGAVRWTLDHGIKNIFTVYTG